MTSPQQTPVTRQDIADLRDAFSRELQYYATKADIAEVRGELRALRGEVRLLLGGMTLGLAALTLILKYLG